MTADPQDELYREAAARFGSVLARVARAYELDTDKRKDLLQEIHFALWRSFASFAGRCSLLTWVLRVAQHTGATHVVRQKRARLAQLTTLEEIESAPDPKDYELEAERLDAAGWLLRLIHRLKPLDRQLMLLYLEDLDTSTIAEITGRSPAAVRTQIHRIRRILAQRFQGVDRDEP